MRISFRTKTFLAIVVVALAALAISALLSVISGRRQTYGRIESTLVAEARLAAELIGNHLPPGQPLAQPDEVADALGRDIGARVTLIASDGRVLGDSAEDGAALVAMENHGSRPEVIEARARGLGIARRYSTTVGTDMLYVAARTGHPAVATVRLALPLTEIDQQLRSIGQITLLALAVALVSAVGLSWLLSSILGRRVRAIAEIARRYASTDPSRARHDARADEIDTIARVLDDAVRELEQRLSNQARDRARLEAILARMVEGVLLVDAQSRVQLANEAAHRMLNLPASALGWPCVESIRHPDVTALLNAALEGRDPDPVELSLGHESEPILAARAATVAAPDGRGALLVLHDITPLRRADRVRRDFVANVSHELRTPLTAIRGYIEALRDDPADSAVRQRSIDVIDRHAGRMERLIRDLLRLAWLEARREPVETTPTGIRSAFDAVVADLAPAIAARRQTVDIHVDDGAALVMADADTLRDALRNLVENAVAYGPDEGTIRLTATRADDHVAISIEDDGPGIPPQDLSRIFERFYRVDPARSRESGGTGLGLSIVKHLVERLGGEIRAANRPTGGAIFTIRLPAARRSGQGPGAGV